MIKKTFFSSLHLILPSPSLPLSLHEKKEIETKDDSIEKMKKKWGYS